MLRFLLVVLVSKREDEDHEVLFEILNRRPEHHQQLGRGAYIIRTEDSAKALFSYLQASLRGRDRLLVAELPEDPLVSPLPSLTEWLKKMRREKKKSEKQAARAAVFALTRKEQRKAAARRAVAVFDGDDSDIPF